MKKIKDSNKDVRLYDNEHYDHLPRFVSYYLQISEILKKHPDNILEIGIGTGFVSDYLKKRGIDTVSCDFNKSLNPDIVADIRKLKFKESSFDVITAFDVLEHIPYSDLEIALENLRKVTKKYVIISIPRPGIYINFLFRFRGIVKFFDRELINFFIKIPPFYKNYKFDGIHYWEIGWKNFPVSKIKKDIKKKFSIEKTFIHPICPDEMIFILKK